MAEPLTDAPVSSAAPAPKTPKKRNGLKNTNRIRTAVQILFFGIVTILSLHSLLSAIGIFIPEISLHTICPFGGVVSLYSLFSAGTLIQKIHDSALVIMSLAFLLALLFGPVFCGWLCPLGSLQEWVGKLGKRLFGKKYNHFIPGKVDRILRYARYLVLLWVVIMTAFTAKLIFQDVDPYYALFNFFTGEVSLIALSVLFATVIGSLFVERPWCKYLCPYGALLGLFNFTRVFRIKRKAETCIDCGICDRECPMNINVSEKQIIHDHQCISCMKCTSDAACPVSDTVTFSCRRK